MTKDCKIFGKIMHRGMIPTRVRRRQSDAKWRASVAMCYNIMKTVIPNQKKLGRRKVSKALTLKETERHILNLEKKLRELIDVRAPLMGKVVMVKKEDECLYPATFEDIKHEFATIQLSFFASNSGSGKKRYNIPADIEASLDNVSQQSSRLVVLNLSDVQSSLPTLPRMFQTSKKKTQKLKSPNQGPDQQSTADEREKYQESQTSKQQKTPSKSHRWMAADVGMSPPERATFEPVATNMVKTPAKTPRSESLLQTTPRSESLLQTTPLKMESGISSGFTPVKLPLHLDCCDPVLSFPTTPVHLFPCSSAECISMPETPASCFTGMEDFNLTEEEESTNLLCTESIDTLDLDDCFHLRSYVKPESDQTVPGGEETASNYDDLDGYMFLYNQYASKSFKDSEAMGTIPQMWQSLDENDNEVYASLASINGCHDNASLSPDLMGIDLKPLNKEVQEHDDMYHDNHHHTDVGHEVPEVDDEHILKINKWTNKHRLLPDYEDLGIIFTEEVRKDTKHWFRNHEAVDEGEDSQIVPDICLY